MKSLTAIKVGFFLFLSVNLFAIKCSDFITICDTVPQNEIKNPHRVEPPKLYSVVDQQPEFPNGVAALLKYIKDNMAYPEEARKNNIEGKTVLQFIVDEEGLISDIQVVRKIGYGCDEEAIRIIKNMPKWSPGKRNGRPVKVRYTLPISFKLDQ